MNVSVCVEGEVFKVTSSPVRIRMRKQSNVNNINEVKTKKKKNCKSVSNSVDILSVCSAQVLAMSALQRLRQFEHEAQLGSVVDAVEQLGVYYSLHKQRINFQKVSFE